MKRTYKTSLETIPALAKDISKQMKGGEIFGLIGDLGAGKTTFAKALAKELKVKSHVTSPTFVIMNRYPACLGLKQKIHFYHIDAYRTNGFNEIEALGVKEFWGQPDTVTVIEWADLIKTHLPKNTIFIHFI